MGIPAHGQAVGAAKTHSERVEPQLLPGVVLEKVEKNSEAEKAGLREGDVLLSWSQKEIERRIESPFDIDWIEVEHIPFGPIVLHGTRKGIAHVWDVKSLTYQTARPNFGPAFFARYTRGRQLAAAGKLDEAVMIWSELAALVAAERSPWLKSWLLWSCAQSFHHANNWQQAERFYEQAIQAVTSPAIRSELLLESGWSFRTRGDLDTAIAYLEEKVLPEVHRMMSLEESIDRRDATLSGNLFCPLPHDDPGSVEPPVLTTATFASTPALIALEVMSQERGDLQKADDYVQQLRAIYRQFGSETVIGLIAMADISFRRDDLRTASKYYRQVLMTCQSGHNTGLNGLGIVADAQGDSVQAEHYFRQALLDYKGPSGLSTAITLGNLGLAIHNQGRFVTAEHYYRKQYAMLRRIWPDSIYMASCLNHLGVNSHSLGNLSAAEKYLRESLQIREKMVPNSLEHAYSLNDLGDVIRDAGRLEDAERLYRRALEIRQTLAAGSKHHAEVLASLALIMRRRGEPDEAEQLYAQAMEALETQLGRLAGGTEVRSGFRAQRENYYQEYVDLLMARGKTERAYSVLERSRGRGLLEVMNSAHVDVHTGVDAGTLKRVQSLRAEIEAKSERRIRLLTERHSEELRKALDKEIAGLLSQYHDVEAQIRTTSPAYAALTQPQPLTAKEVQTQLLDPDTLLLEYSLGEERSYVFAVTSDSVNAFELPKR
jgi:tetratricopeptide (TPR) repeat protein